jgi:hypothetical protein
MDAAFALGPIVRRVVRIVAGLIVTALATHAGAATHLLVLGGIGGEPRYDKLFQRQIERIEKSAQARLVRPGKVVVASGADATKAGIATAFAEFGRGMRAADAAVVILIGHGSFDGEQYRFNIAGPDLTGADLAQHFDALPAKRQLLIATTSASGAVAEAWRGEERLVITATRSGTERNATRFGEFCAEAFTSGEADTDKSGDLSARELFDFVTRKVTDSYRDDGALATEHARLEGRFAEAFVVMPLRAAATVDAATAKLLEQRAALEREIATVRARREAMKSDEYLDLLEPLMRQLAELQQRIDRATPAKAGDDAKN